MGQKIEIIMVRGQGVMLKGEIQGFYSRSDVVDALIKGKATIRIVRDNEDSAPPAPTAPSVAAPLAELEEPDFSGGSNGESEGEAEEKPQPRRGNRK